MSYLRWHRVLLFGIVLLFAVGHSHQVFGRFYAHDHVIAAYDHHEHDGNKQNEADHMAEHTLFVAIVPAPLVPVIHELQILATVDLKAVRMAEPQVTAIDHPPRLIG